MSKPLDARDGGGFGSVASFPLRVEGEVIGTFTLIAAEEDAFDNAELELLEEMAADLAFGIQTLRSELRRVAAEEAAQRATTHDAITNLPGRALLMRNLEQAMHGAGRDGGVSADLPGPARQSRLCRGRCRRARSGLEAQVHHGAGFLPCAPFRR
ncbi:MAG: GAF domain-containing protein [Betaproteobacteria bacterium]|nr:MAG: GAF domain-containing protein [Betaproteobacteria bacterium]